jgi:hypothetical protein
MSVRLEIGERETARRSTASARKASVAGSSIASARNARFPPKCDVHAADPQCPVNVDFVEEPPVLAPALGICSAVSEADSCLFASQGEGRRRMRDELRQFPQILGGGGQ